ncbi:MAG: hypothetical protein U0324_01910 [Polyangiales bacterium]
MGAFDGALERACDALGLRPERSLLAPRWAGALSGVGVDVARVSVRTGDSDTVVVARPPRRPDVGLHVHGASMIPCFDRKLETGDGAFDGVFALHAAAGEEEAARRVASKPVRRSLQRLSGTGWPAVVDDAVVYEFSMAGTDEAEVRARVEECVRCALAVADAAATLDAPNALRESGVAAAFEATARARGMAVERNAMRAEGTAGRGFLSVRWRVHAPVRVDHFSADDAAVGWFARLRFDEPLGVGLALHPASLAERLRSAVGLRDLQTGDADFDRAWAVAARDEASALLVLHANARRMLNHLATLGLRVSLDDEGLSFEGELPRDPDVVGRAMDVLDGARDALRPQMAVGPYR